VTQLPKIVSTRLAALQNSEHPDADLLTAFAEQTLADRERDAVLNHLSGCALCRQVLALALPEWTSESIAAAVPRRATLLRIPVLRWAALAACLVVVAATVLVERHEQSSHREVQLALKVTPPSAAASQASKPTPSVAERMVSRSEVKAKRRRPPAPNKQGISQELAAADVPEAPASTPASGNVTAADRTQTTETVAVQAGGAPLEATPSAKTDESLRAHNSVAAVKAAPVFTARPSTETAASTMGGAAKLTDFRPPSWRLSEDDGLPERSFASNQWEKVQVDHKAGFRAIAALGMEVWIGGPGGLLYHSEDVGLHWIRVIPVSRSATLTDDITGITFTDHMHGNVNTSSHEAWVTSDAGKTWQIQQP
jgi:Photosynthesis system II assembly factor YCF48/Putative zinc-finger